MHRKSPPRVEAQILELKRLPAHHPQQILELKRLPEQLERQTQPQTHLLSSYHPPQIPSQEEDLGHATGDASFLLLQPSDEDQDQLLQPSCNQATRTRTSCCSLLL